MDRMCDEQRVQPEKMERKFMKLAQAADNHFSHQESPASFVGSFETTEFSRETNPGSKPVQPGVLRTSEFCWHRKNIC